MGNYSLSGNLRINYGAYHQVAPQVILYHSVSSVNDEAKTRAIRKLDGRLEQNVNLGLQITALATEQLLLGVLPEGSGLIPRLYGNRLSLSLAPAFGQAQSE